MLLSELPSVSLHTVKVDISARVCDIASDSVWIEEAFVNFDVLKGNVLQGDSGLSLASSFFIERVKHASGTVSIGFFHLLRSNVDSPPDRSIHCEVGVVNVLNQTCTNISRVGFDIDPFKRPNHSHIPKGDIFYTVTVSFWWNTANCHANP